MNITLGHRGILELSLTYRIYGHPISKVSPVVNTFSSLGKDIALQFTLPGNYTSAQGHLLVEQTNRYLHFITKGHGYFTQ